jgi:hypothetical protein
VVEGGGEANVRGEVGEEVLEVLEAEGAEHFVALAVGLGEITH